MAAVLQPTPRAITKASTRLPMVRCRPANLDNIFVPFFTTKRNGSGVGISMVKQIVRANHGRIGVSSTPGVGTTIRISFRQY
jgi:C4-dicarboxylate-specific signal transduction histidine kinase